MANLIALPNTGVLVDKDTKDFLFNVDNRVALTKLKEALPYLKPKTISGHKFMTAPADDQTVKRLQDYGLFKRGLEPFRWEYDPPLAEGKYPVMKHQIEAAAFMSARPRCYNLSSMRTGKTLTTVLCTDYLQQTKKIKGAVLIISTVSTLEGAWGHTIRTTLPHKTVVIVHGGVGKADRLRRLKQPADYYVINYDGVPMVKDELINMVDNDMIGCVIIDELTHYSNLKTKRSAALHAVINGRNPVKYVYGLTGTPGDDPLPIYGMCMMVNPARVPCNRKTTWQELTMYRWGREAWQWKKRDNSDEIIFNTMMPSIRYDKKDIMDLPPVVKQVRECSLTKEQTKAYDQMRDDMITLMESGEVIEAVHKASLSQKLFQIALGSAITSEGVVDFDITPRIDVIKEVFSESEARKMVIFCPYTAVIDRTATLLRESGITVDVVDGRVTGSKRENIFRNFQTQKNPQIIIAHPRTTAFGVELAAADTILYNGVPLSGQFIYEQSLERLSSLKQKAKQIYIVQVVATPEERAFFRGLDGGVTANALINDMFSSFSKR